MSEVTRDWTPAEASIINTLKDYGLLSDLGKILRKKGGIETLVVDLARNLPAAVVEHAPVEAPKVMVGDEETWKVLLDNAVILVKDPATARKLFKLILNDSDPEIFVKVLSSYQSSGCMRLPFRKYPGVALPF